jgi:hypothetical protein
MPSNQEITLIQQAWEFCHVAGVRLTPEGRSLLRGDLGVWPYFERLMEEGCYADARRVLAQALPKRRALWWACLCARDLYQPATLNAAEVIEVVSHYATAGDEVSRRKAESLGMQFDSDDLLCCLAMAAFFAGDNVSRADLPPVAPQPFVTGRLVEVVVYLTSVRKDPANYKDHLRRYLEQGVRFAAGADPWQEVVTGVGAEVPPACPAAAYAGGAS